MRGDEGLALESVGIRRNFDRQIDKEKVDKDCWPRKLLIKKFDFV
jgi:hypothetical protein